MILVIDENIKRKDIVCSSCSKVACSTEAGDGGAGAAQIVGEEGHGGVASDLSLDRTPTNDAPLMPLLSGEKNLKHSS